MVGASSRAAASRGVRKAHEWGNVFLERKSMRRKDFLIVSLLLLTASASASTWFIDADGTGDYPTIQLAIDASEPGDEIILADGTYTGQGNRDIDYKGKAITVRSENGPANCVIDCEGTTIEPHRGFFFHSGESRKSVLDGVAIVNGTTEDSPFNGGGAIACKYWSNPTIKNCVLSNNTTGEWQGGGGIYCDAYSGPHIYNCVITNNTSGYGGGSGIYCIGSSPNIESCLVSKNSRTGIRCGGSPGSSPTINNCLITFNAGGGITSDNKSNPKIVNCTIYGNTAYGFGGIDAYADCRLTIVNCIIWGNYSHYRANQIDIGNSFLEVRNSDIQGGKQGVSIYDHHDDRFDYIYESSIIVWEESNIDAEPSFIDPVQGDLRLSEGSPCIDTGEDTLFSSLKDIAGNERILDGDHDGRYVIDMGAYEAAASELPVISLSTWELEFVYNAENSPQRKLHFQVFNSGGSEFSWEVVSDSPWLEVSPANGSISSQIQDLTVRILPDGLEPGNYVTAFSLHSPQALNSPQIVTVSLINVGDVLPVPSQFATIGEAVDYAPQGATIVIDDGIYTGAGNTKIRVSKAVRIRGSGPQNCIVDCENKWSALDCYVESDESLIIEGLTFRNAIEYSRYSPIDIRGNVVLKDCRIENCVASEYYGSVSITNGAVIENCVISNNLTGVYCNNGVTISNCLISNNYGGPAILCMPVNDEISPCNIISCIIQDNYGGGLFLARSSPTISNCIIRGNAVTELHDGYGIGGGIACVSDCRACIRNTLFEANYAQFGGGAISCEDNSSVSVVNCTLVGNEAGVIGGGLWAFDDSSFDVSNSIIWQNMSDVGKQIAQEFPEFPGSSLITLDYNCIHAGESDVFGGVPLQVTFGTGNIEQNPEFAGSGYWYDNGTSQDPLDDFWVGGDYHLQSAGWRWSIYSGEWTWDAVTSPCIDAGNPGMGLNEEPETLTVDPLNRLGKNIRINMGVYGGTPEASMPPHGWAFLCDLTNDGAVDNLDLVSMLQLWLEENEYLFGDVNRNGAINLDDFSILAEQWMTSVSR